MGTFLIILALIAVGWSAFGFYFERDIETPKYSVLEKKPGYEIRQYQPYLAAQVEVTGTYEQASREGFKILADYIFGNNLKPANLDMASPLSQGRQLYSQTMSMATPVITRVKQNLVLAMTAPVLETKTTESNIRIISFVMSAKYNLETLPKPNNPGIKIVLVPAKKKAVLQFSWYATAGRVEQKKQELLDCLKRDGVASVFTPQAARYNAPFNAPWMNRNEILVEMG